MSWTHRRQRRTVALSTLPALLLCLAACGGSDDGDTKSKGDDKETAHLTFAAVEKVVTAKVPADATCAAYKWTDVNPTLAPAFSEAKESHELGCWAAEDDVSASIPAEVLYAEFADEATATTFAKENFQFSYDIVQDGAILVLVDIVNRPDLAEDIAAICGCQVEQGKTP